MHQCTALVARCTPRALQIYCWKFVRRDVARSESGELSTVKRWTSSINNAVCTVDNGLRASHCIVYHVCSCSIRLYFVVRLRSQIDNSQLSTKFEVTKFTSFVKISMVLLNAMLK